MQINLTPEEIQALLSSELMEIEPSEDGDVSPPSLGERIQRLRQHLKLSRKQAADKLGLSCSTLTSYEKNRRCPSVPTLLRMSRLYQVSAHYLLTGAEFQPADYHLEELLQKENLYFRGLPLKESTRNRLMDILYGIELGIRQQDWTQ